MNDSPLIQIQNSGKTGREYWRSLEELSNTPQFAEWVQREFPAAASELPDGESRRDLLKLMAASFGLAGLTACSRPIQKILPNVKGVDDYVPGKPVFYATAMSLGGSATGLLVEANDGRPTKVEGNPQHPFSLGAANTYHQASILGLYDPDRLANPVQDGKEATWDDFKNWAKDAFAKLGDGSGLRFLSETVNSPSLAAVRDAALQKFPKAKWIEYEAVPHNDSGTQLAFGQNLTVRPRFDKAEVILSLDSDFLGLDSNTVLPVKEYSKGRRVTSPKDDINRLYVVESHYSLTGAMADHRLRMRSGDVQAFASDLLAALGGGNVSSNNDERRKKFIESLAKDLSAHKGKSVVVAGPRQPAEVQAIAHLLNQTLGNIGETVTYYKPLNADAKPQLDALKELAGDLSAGRVNTLVILGGNPAFTAPADLDFGSNLKKTAAIYLGPELDETAVASKWALPQAHYLEAWGDAAAPDGTVAIQQPLIQPLFGGKSASELVAFLTGYRDQRGYDIVKNYWLAKVGGEKQWRHAVHDGVVPNTQSAEVRPSADAKKVSGTLQGSRAPQGIEVTFVQSSSLYDGRFANNAWMQELPEPMTKITWDNGAWMSLATAKQLGVTDGDMIVIERNGRSLEIGAVILPGHADNSITIPVGYGRTNVGRVGTGVGFNAYKIRTTDAFGFGDGFSVRKGSGTHTFARTQDHWTIDELGKKEETRRASGLVREASIEEYRKQPEFVKEFDEHPPLVSLYDHPADYTKGYQWGMAIDLNACVGCNACTIACQSENNIPVVGKYQVIRGREMHWIRLDRYFKGSVDNPQIVTQPIPCMQCQEAPCENVCPVAATTHSPEGLNDMAYNRCVGTRYCLNNCPYKVRRFNFLNWNYGTPEVQKMHYNPDVTVRMRGVMEKCTYCVQRIQETRIAAKVDGHREIKDGEIVTACAQTCPADAIVFGNINDPNSRVSQIKKQQRNYVLLEELNTKPRTSYLAKLRNPNPELEEQHG